MLGEMHSQTVIDTGQRRLQFQNRYKQAKLYGKTAKIRAILQAEEVTHVPHKGGVVAWHTVEWEGTLDGAASR